MRGGNVRHRLSILIACCVASFASASVLDADANGFTVRHQVLISADRETVYEAALANVAAWWSADHTVSGNAANLYMDVRVLGCFCETLGDGAGLAHLSITFVNPGVMVRFSGGLGPLGLMGVAGNMTWEFEDNEEGTQVTLQYAVGGYLKGGLDKVSAPVDSVLIDAMQRLKSYVETGSPISSDAP